MTDGSNATADGSDATPWWDLFAGVPIIIQVLFWIGLAITLISFISIVALASAGYRYRRGRRLGATRRCAGGIRLPLGVRGARARRGGHDRRQRRPAARGRGHAQARARRRRRIDRPHPRDPRGPRRAGAQGAHAHRARRPQGQGRGAQRGLPAPPHADRDRTAVRRASARAGHRRASSTPTADSIGARPSGSPGTSPTRLSAACRCSCASTTGLARSRGRRTSSSRRSASCTRPDEPRGAPRTWAATGSSTGCRRSPRSPTRWVRGATGSPRTRTSACGCCRRLARRAGERRRRSTSRACRSSAVSIGSGCAGRRADGRRSA